MATLDSFNKILDRISTIEEELHQLNLYSTQNDREKQWMNFFRAMDWICTPEGRPNVLEVSMIHAQEIKLKVFIRSSHWPLSFPPTKEYLEGEARKLRDAGELMPFVVVGREPIWEDCDSEFKTDVGHPDNLLILGVVMYDMNKFYSRKVKKEIVVSVWSLTIDLYQNIWVYIFEVDGHWMVNNFKELENKPPGYYKHDVSLWYSDIVSKWNGLRKIVNEKN